MYVIYGKGVVGNSIKKLLDLLDINNYLMDDKDYNDNILKKTERIIVSPGIPPFNKVYQNYSKKIIGELDLVENILTQKNITNYFEFIGVTGTDGKSSVCRILYNLFKQSFDQIDSDIKVHLGGNYGKPLSEIVFELIQTNLSNKQILILEISSFMGYNLKNFNFDYSIWTNFQTDHLNWHKDMNCYYKSKLKIIKNTKYGSFLGDDIFNKIKQEKINNIYPIQKYDIKDTNFRGEHNTYNIGCCNQLFNMYLKNNNINISSSTTTSIINNIKPLDHRIQLIKTIKGINIYDDGKSTTANSLKAAINSFDQKIILIAGGSDKGDDFEKLENDFKNNVAGAVFLGETSNKFANIFKKLNIPYSTEKNMSKSVDKAYQLANQQKTKNILFSPGCASFDLFKNRLDRVEQFLQEVKKIK